MIAGSVLVGTGTISAQPSPEQVCPGSHLFDATGSTHTYTAPDGYEIIGHCVKAGSAQQGDGPEVSSYPGDPVTQLTFSHSTGKDISHYSVVLQPTDPEGPEEPKEVSICHLAGAAFPYWEMLVLSPEDAAWHLADHEADSADGCGDNQQVKICKQIDGYWEAVLTDPASANWLLETGQAVLIENCKDPVDPTPQPEPTPTPQPEPEPTPKEQPEVIDPVVERADPAAQQPAPVDEAVETPKANKPQPESKAPSPPEVLGSTVTRTELARTGTSSAELAGYATLLIGAGMALRVGSSQLRRLLVRTR